MDQPALDVIAVGAHPDDVEIGCGGTLARLVEQGYRVGIVDLTDGEPTPGSAGPEVRLAEARRAAEILGVHRRITLDLPNRRLFDSPEARIALAKEFRKHRPRLVLGLGAKTPTASPDHDQAVRITEAAVFYSRLSKWDGLFDGLPVHRISILMHYYLEFRSLSPPTNAGLVVDVGDTLERKFAALAAYQSQFPPERAEVLERIRIFNRQQGLSAGFAAGEILAPTTTLGTRDLMGLMFGPAGQR
jgi:bacillithiol biosynthesis deacetylase BshB1